MVLESLFFVVALICSALGGVLGMASGVFLVPVLTEFCGVEFHNAVTASLVSVIACSCSSAGPFLKSKLTNVRLAVVLEVATTLGALCGMLLFGIVSDRLLFGLFAVILAVSAQQMWAKRKARTVVSSTPNNSISQRFGLNPEPNSSDPDAVYEIQRLPVGMFLMYGAGLISALLGIGSGVLKIPAMDTALGLPIKVSSATSNFMIGVTAAASACAYFAHGDIVPSIAAPIALGSLAGAPIGSKLLRSTSNEKLRVLFSVLLILLAIQMTMAAFGIHIAKGGE